MSLTDKLRKATKISILQFIRLNFLKPNIHRAKGCYIIPYRGTHIQMHRTARINLNSGNMTLNGNKIGGSRAECLILLRENAVWDVNGILFLYYNTGVQVHKDAHLSTGDLRMNTEGLIICAKRISIGNTCSMARRVFIFDSDHHPIYNDEGKRINEAKDIVIEDRVWMGLKSTVMKGAHIGHDTVIGTHSLVAGEIPPHAMVATAPARPVMKDISWER
ncbi:MAG: acyltransferase [Butyrivibrio sp.]|nr:acyltransferase [Acetatifactor muris]MCM1558921.1 acyltransferase [Butyrivibrio sp.]